MRRVEFIAAFLLISNLQRRPGDPICRAPSPPTLFDLHLAVMDIEDSVHQHILEGATYFQDGLPSSGLAYPA